MKQLGKTVVQREGDNTADLYRVFVADQAERIRKQVAQKIVNRRRKAEDINEAKKERSKDVT
jgi:hypothetical protein